MNYDLSLSQVSIALGIIYLLSHLPGVFSPATYIRFAKSFPRHYWIGAVLTSCAGVALAWVTLTTDLGELSAYRYPLTMAWLVGTALQIIFVPEFLAVRGLGMCMLMAVLVMLDAAFLVDSPARLVITCLAYLWAIGGIILVASPYLLRDLIDWTLPTTKRCQFFSGLGALFGILLLALGWFVY